jgi:hemoglobin
VSDDVRQMNRSPYEMVGGSEVVRQIVERFYDLLETDPQYGELRAMHATDLAPMRRSLSGFLTGWLGGPRDWFDQRPGACMMSMHRGMVINAATAWQWSDAMRRAVTTSVPDPIMGGKLAEALGSLAKGMANVPETEARD